MVDRLTEETNLREDLQRAVALELSASEAHVTAVKKLSKATKAAEEMVAAVVATAVASGVDEEEAESRLAVALKVVVPKAVKDEAAEEERTREELSAAAKKSAVKAAKIEDLLKEMLAEEARRLATRTEAEAAAKVPPLQVTIGIFRGLGWLVESHHDSIHEGELRTTWIFAKGSMVIRGCGRDDVEALEQIRSAVMQHEPDEKPASNGVAAEQG